MKRAPQRMRVWPILLGLVAVIALTVSWPWWYTYLLWRESNTSWTAAGPGVNPDTFAIINATEAGPALIPKIIHQTWKDEHIPPEWQAAQQSCRDLHPGFEYMLWTDESSRAFIADKFPELLATWDSYPYVIQRADFIRYAVLQEYGGFYIDLDIECLRPLDFLQRYPFVMPQTQPVGFSNDFIAAEAGNPFVRTLVAALPLWNVNLVFKYPTVMFSTGPMFVTLKASLYSDRSSLWVLPDDVYNKYVSGKRPLFTHLHGSSWHGDDAKSVLWVVHHPLFLAILTLTGMVPAVAYFWQQLYGRRGFGLRKEGPPYPALVEIMTVKDS